MPFALRPFEAWLGTTWQGPSVWINCVQHCVTCRDKVVTLRSNTGPGPGCQRPAAVTLSGAMGDDAMHDQEKQVRKAIERVQP